MRNGLANAWVPQTTAPTCEFHGCMRAWMRACGCKPCSATPSGKLKSKQLIRNVLELPFGLRDGFRRPNVLNVPSKSGGDWCVGRRRRGAPDHCKAQEWDPARDHAACR